MHTQSNPPTSLERCTAKLILELTPGSAAVALAKHASDCPACDGESKCRCTPQLSTHGVEDEGGWFETLAAIARPPKPHRTLADEEAKVIHTTQCVGGKIITVIRYPERGRLERACEVFVTGEGMEPGNGDLFQAIADAHQEQANELGVRLAIYWPLRNRHRLEMTFTPRKAAATSTFEIP